MSIFRNQFLKRVVVTAAAMTVCILIVLLIYHSESYTVEIDNTNPVEKIITEDYGLERLLLAEAIFNVRDGFGDVYSYDLADEVEIRLECKRQVSPTQFYYVVCGDGYRCFLFVDEGERIQEVLVATRFSTIEETKKQIEDLSMLDRSLYLTDSADYATNFKSCGHSAGYWHQLFTLQDGALIMKEPYPLSKGVPEYFFYTNEEWMKNYEDWNGFVILPIDKCYTEEKPTIE